MRQYAEGKKGAKNTDHVTLIEVVLEVRRSCKNQAGNVDPIRCDKIL